MREREVDKDRKEREREREREGYVEERQRAIGKHKGYINKSHIEKREDKHIEIKIENIRREAERYRGTKREQTEKQ